MASQQKADPHVRQCGNIVQTTNTPFPANTRGFLYFHSVANQSPLSGGLRFRVTENPSSFIEGHDLLMDSGLPWQIPIWELTTRKQWRTFLKVLVADGFAPPEMQIACNSMNVERDSVFITAFNMPWLVNFDWEFSRVYFAPPDRHPTPALVRLPWYSKAGFVRTPYTGRALVSLVTRSDGQLGLRVEKILSLQHRATNDRTIVPKEGQVTPFKPRLILKTTKMSEKKMDQLSGFIHSAINRMPSAPTTPNPLDVYRHHPLPRSQLDFLIAKCGVHPELGGYKPYPSLAN
ncbi:hypothetical protein C8R43DRAFT_1126796 [Mycena crocata]|nr:hypothetical protein C8R43DRAFT_1126796 [Mycena crocata]